MMREGYYYLITSLPDLSLTDKQPGYTIPSFRALVLEQLKPADAKLLQILHYRYDIENLGKLIKDTNEPWDPAGNFDPDEMRGMLSSPDALPVFLQVFVQEFSNSWARMSKKDVINAATTCFIDWSHTIANTFLRKWLYFDQNLKNLLIWLNSRKFGLDPSNEVLGNHFEAQYLRSTKSGELNLKAWDFQFREALRHYDNPNIALREVIINEMRWHYLDELVQPHPFGIEQLLAFAIRLQLINRNLADSEEAGSRRLQELIKSIRKDDHSPELLNKA